MNEGGRVVMIGFDALDPTLVRRWAGEGYLPTFAALLDRGASYEVENEPGVEAGSVWATFARGVSVARHGQYDGLRRFNPQTYTIDDFVAEQAFGFPPFWEQLSSNGKRIALIDPPYMRPTHGLNGVAITNWGLHDPVTPDRVGPVTWPPELADEIEAEFGIEPLRGQPCDLVAPRTRREVARFRDRMIERARVKADMTIRLLEQEPWDLCLVTFCEAHCGGHHLWRVHDTTRPDHDPKVARAIGDPLRDLYRALDAELARIVTTVESQPNGDETTVLLYLSHGMEPSVSGSILLDKILVRLAGDDFVDRSHGAIGVVRSAWKRLPAIARRALTPLMHRIWPTGVGSAMQGGREQREFFEVPANNTTGGVRINLVGREADGIVEPGPEYDALLTRLQDDLSEIVNLDTGAPVAERVVATRDLYPEGEQIDALPDLLVDWNKTASPGDIRRVASPKIGAIDHGRPGPRSGDHGKTNGMMLAFGPGIEPARVPVRVSVTDLAPTITHLVGGSVHDYDGSPIGAINAEGAAD
jgi:predicted AlkP superfamily phosphohydrolase/phosphomutase